MTRQELGALDDRALIRACLSPVVVGIRGRGFDVKSAAYRELAPPQQALLAFHVLHGHATDVDGFWSYVRLFTTAWAVWPLLEESASQLSDDRLLKVYRDLAAAVHADADRDPAVAMSLYRAYLDAAGSTVHAVAERIRKHPEQYVHLT